MTYLMGVILYTGAACISPVTTTDQATVVSKTPCAEVVNVISGNPFKVVQEQNVVSLAQPKIVKAATKKATKKPTKKKRKKRRR
jgi:hypothetical protein